MKRIIEAFEDFDSPDDIIEEMSAQLDKIQQARGIKHQELADTIIEAVRSLDNPPIHQYVSKLLDDSTPDVDGISHLPPRIQAAILASKRRNTKRDRACERVVAILFLILLFGIASGIPSVIEAVQKDFQEMLDN